MLTATARAVFGTMVRRASFSNTSQLAPLPKLAVFDLDHTLWPFGVDSFCFIPPYHVDQITGKVVDMCAQPIEHFADVPQILQNLRSNGVKIAVASRTKYPTGAYILLELLKLKPYIDYFEIYPGKKLKHFDRLKAQSGFVYEDMIFFDDEPRNIDDIGPLGVHAVLVDHDSGLTEPVFRNSLSNFAARNVKQKS